MIRPIRFIFLFASCWHFSVVSGCTMRAGFQDTSRLSVDVFLPDSTEIDQLFVSAQSEDSDDQHSIMLYPETASVSAFDRGHVDVAMSCPSRADDTELLIGVLGLRHQSVVAGHEPQTVTVRAGSATTIRVFLSSTTTAELCAEHPVLFGDVICGNGENTPSAGDQSDTDGDGYTDSQEDACGSSPLLADDIPQDSDGDGVCDPLDLCQGNDASGDSDNDALCDDQDGCIDVDGDGLGNGSPANTACACSATDADDLNATTCADIDDDGCDDCSNGTFDPNNDGPDADGDGVCDATEICFNSTRTVAIGASGALAYSDDGGLSWNLSTLSGAFGELTDVAFGMGRFVAVGLSGLIIESANGTTWTQAESGTSADLRAVVYAEHGYFGVVGDQGTFLHTPNGGAWVAYPNALGTSSLVDIAYDIRRRQWLVLDSQSDVVHVAALAIGPTWSSATSTGSGEPHVALAASDSGDWLVTDRLGVSYLSADAGGTWSVASVIASPDAVTSVVRGKGTFFAGVGSSPHEGLLASADGSAWARVLATPSFNVSSLHYDCGGGLLYAGSNDGRVAVHSLGEEAALTATVPGAVAVSGVATNAHPPVRLKVLTSGGVDCSQNAPFASDGGQERWVRRVDLQLGPDGHPDILGIGTGNNHRMHVSARIRIREAGDYTFRLTLGAGDSALLHIDGAEVISGSNCYTSRTGTTTLSAGYHDLEIYYWDDGWHDGLTLRYQGPDSGDVMTVVPPAAFAP